MQNMRRMNEVFSPDIAYEPEYEDGCPPSDDNQASEKCQATVRILRRRWVVWMDNDKSRYDVLRPRKEIVWRHEQQSGELDQIGTICLEVLHNRDSMRRHEVWGGLASLLELE